MLRITTDPFGDRLKKIAEDAVTTFEVLVAKNNPRKIRIKMLKSDLEIWSDNIRTDLKTLAREMADDEEEDRCHECERGDCDNCDRGNCEDCDRWEDGHQDGYDEGKQDGRDEMREELESQYQEEIEELKEEIERLKR